MNGVIKHNKITLIQDEIAVLAILKISINPRNVENVQDRDLIEIIKSVSSWNGIFLMCWAS